MLKARHAGSATAFGLAALLLIPTAAAAEVPLPSLQGFDGQARRQLEEGRAAFEGSLAKATDGLEQSAAYGDLGRLYLAYDLFDAAQAALTEAAKLAPNAPAWSYYLGYLVQQEGELDAAATHLAQALALEPGEAATTLRLAAVELDRGNLEAARKLYRSALDQAAARAAAHDGLGRLATLEGDPDLAIEHYQAALEIQPSATRLHYPLALAYRRRGEIDRARAELERQGTGAVLAPDPRIDRLETLRSGASVHLVRAMMDFQAGRLEQSRQEYEKAIDADPGRLELRQSYAAMLEKGGDLEAALVQLRVARKLDPGNALTLKSLGRVLANTGATQDAITALSQVIDLDASAVDARLDLARLLEHQGQPEAALVHYREALELEPWSLPARLQTGLLLIRQGRLEEAVTELRAVVRADPANVTARLNLGSALAALDRPEEAEGELRHLLALPETEASSDSLARARFNLSLILRRRAQVQAEAGADAVALQILEAGMAEFPGSGELAHALARLLATSDDPEIRDGARALELATAVFRSQQSLDHAETLAMALAELGRFQEAAGVQTEVLELARREGVESGILQRLETTLGGYRQGKPVRNGG